MGGAWERIIRSIRKILRALLGQQLISDKMLRTMMTEVQEMLNSRPLIPVSSDSKDLEPLPPNHLLLLGANPNYPAGFLARKMFTASAVGDKSNTCLIFFGSPGLKGKYHGVFDIFC